MRSEKEQTKAIYKAIAERVFHFNYEKILVYFYYNFCLMLRVKLGVVRTSIGSTLCSCYVFGGFRSIFP